MHTTAPHRRRRPLRIRLATSLSVTAAAALAVGVAVVGCASDTGKENAKTKQRYATLDPKKDFPAYMKGTIWELTQRNYDGDLATSSYGLVGRLRGTGEPPLDVLEQAHGVSPPVARLRSEMASCSRSISCLNAFM